MSDGMRTFEARYAGKCGGCGERIKEGDLVGYDDSDVLVHADCADAAPVERPAVVCHQCWLTKPCDCEGER